MNRCMTLGATLVFLMAGGGLGGSPAAGHPGPDDARWVWPLEPTPPVVRPFVRPADPWGPGHRGVDLPARDRQSVVSIGAGEVTFAGPIAGRGVVVVRHGPLRSTYEPVSATVAVGDRVAAGRPIGLVQAAPSHCAPAVCLHLGVRRGDAYVDPLSLLGERAVRLKPMSGAAAPLPADAGAVAGSSPAPTPAGSRASATGDPGGGSGLRRVAGGAALITSALLAAGLSRRRSPARR